VPQESLLGNRRSGATRCVVVVDGIPGADSSSSAWLWDGKPAAQSARPPTATRDIGIVC
jgi:hypothetical protein